MTPLASVATETDPGRLGPAERAAAIARMQEGVYDVVVIGGGATGAGCALDAATRGLRVCLLEARDYAAGTSSRSSKLIHGGLRYLEQLDFTLVREALRERSLLLNTLCPHLVRPVPFMMPLEGRFWERPYIGAGLILYDSLGGHEGMPRHRHLTKRGALRIAPGLKPDALIGAIQYYDCGVDDARHTLDVVRTAAHFGADVATNLPASGFLRESERVTGVTFHDMVSGEDGQIQSRQVINATGVWTDDIQHLIGERGKFQVRASKGVHLVVPRDRIQLDTGLILRTEKSVLFVIPWGRHWIVGTTDTDWELDKSHPAANHNDIEYVLDHVNEVLVNPLTHEDVQGVYAGLRPLLTGESAETSKLSREHAVSVPVPGVVAVAGGKYTTYRVMARDAVDAAARGLDQQVAPCATAVTPLLGADGYQALWNQRHRIAADSGLHVARIEHLLGRHGSEIGKLLDMIEAEPELGKPLGGAEDYLRVEVRYAASHEGALHLDDVLTRRTRISIETFDRGVGAAREAAELMAPVLEWTDEQVDREVDIYEQRVQAERESQEKRDDQAADAARLSAPDPLRYAQGDPAA
ncbi:glycerol-3-phosphate dehydrogenase/oxidase [Thermoleophilia bacterium SCSIO 60948]|nr:glycerol-3-phosphate dehydrogenase/oxidase [Thermoleophilia bacterium SCSIO 60948]